MKVLALAIAATLAASTATANDFRGQALNGDRYASAAERIASKVIEGRNDRVSASQRLVSAIRKSAADKGTCKPAKVKPGETRASFEQQIRKAFKGAEPKTVVKATKITSRFMHKGALIRVCVSLEGRGHHLSSIHMTSTKENWSKAAEELRKRLEALKNNA